MYKKFYRLTENPFNLNPDPHFLFPSAQHKEAFKYLMYAIENRDGLMELVGEVGCGKTLLCRVILSSLGDNVKTALVMNPPSSKTEFLESLMEDLGLPYRNKSYKDLLQSLADFLTAEYANGNNVVVFIDEAQDLNLDILEGIRFLTNIETNKKKLIQVVLVGQPELEANLRSPKLRHVDQRIGMRCHLKPLNKKETEEYIYYRLKVAGTESIKFSRGALKKIHHFSCGIPRLVNQVCDKTLITAYYFKRSDIDGEIVNKALKTTQKRWSRFRIPAIVYPLHAAFAFALVCILILFVVNWHMQRKIISWTKEVNPSLGLVKTSVTNRLHLPPQEAEAHVSPAAGSGRAEEPEVEKKKSPLPEGKESGQKGKLTPISEQKAGEKKLAEDRAALKRELNALNTRLDNIKKEMNRKEKTVSRDVMRLEEKLSNTRLELAREKKEKEALARQEKDVNQKVAALNRRLNGVKKQLADKEDKSERELARLKEKLDKTHEQLAKEREAKEKLLARDKTVSRNFSALSKGLEELKKQLAGKEHKSGRELAELKEKLDETQQQLGKERAVKDDLLRKEKAINEKVANLYDQLKKVKDRLVLKEAEANNKLLDLNRQLVATRQQLLRDKAEREDEKEFSVALTDLKSQLKDIRRGLRRESSSPEPVKSARRVVVIRERSGQGGAVDDRRVEKVVHTERQRAEMKAMTSLIKLWGKKVDGSALQRWPVRGQSLDFKAVARRYGLDAVVLSADFREITNLNLPCIILPAADKKAIDDPVFLSKISAGKAYSNDGAYPIEKLSAWRGKAVVLWENIDGLRDGDIPVEENSRELMRVAKRLQQLGYLAEADTDLEQIRFALISFQRDHLLPGSPVVGEQTKLVLYRIINQPVTPTLNREFI